MAGRKPSGRVKVSLRIRPDDVALVDEIAGLSGTNRSTVLASVFDETLPVLRLQFDAMKQVAESPKKAAEVIANLAEQGRAQIAQAEMEFKREASRGRRAAR